MDSLVCRKKICIPPNTIHNGRYIYICSIKSYIFNQLYLNSWPLFLIVGSESGYGSENYSLFYSTLSFFYFNLNFDKFCLCIVELYLMLGFFLCNIACV